MPLERFPFGRPVSPRAPSADGPRAVFVLGAYPSALHVSWVPPRPFARVRALAVDNEPTPFWTGDDQAARVASWKQLVSWEPAWGEVAPVGTLNGPSGAWVAEKVLGPLNLTRADAWITDCLDTYRVSTDAEARLVDTYAPFATAHRLPDCHLLSHPSEAAIVREALATHRPRLLRELATARPGLVVTLGNAALRVFAALGTSATTPRKLTVDTYGRRHRLRLPHGEVEWLPLAHPAAPRVYQDEHARWCASQP